MLVETKHFGQMEIDNSRLIRFESGIPGFENVKEYVVIENGDEKSPFKWLQSCDAPELAFAIIDPFAVKKDYDFEISNEVVEKLGIESEKDVEVYSIVVVPEVLEQISMNLKAPLVINAKNHKGSQIVLDTDKYSVRHYILDEIRRQEAEHACTDKEKRPVDHHK